MNSLLDKSIIVTGGASGMGREMTIAVAREGARVSVADVSTVAIERLQLELTELGLSDRVRFERIDLSEEGSGQRLVQRVVDTFGGIYGLVNNAGVGRSIVGKDIFKSPPKFWEMNDEAWKKFIAINATAVFQTMKAASSVMIKQRAGRIVNVTTSLDTMLNGGAVGYGPSKAAAEALTSVAANDLRGTGVTVNVLIPGGPVDTGMIPDDAPIHKDSLLPADCMNKPLLWLLSDAAQDVTAVRIRAHLWSKGATPAESLEASSAPVAWTQLTGQLRKARLI